MLIAALASAQTPSFTAVPVVANNYAEGVSPNGRFVIAKFDTPGDYPIRWDRLTGTVDTLPSVAPVSNLSVLDDGRVFGERDEFLNATRVFRWDPGTGQVVWVTRTGSGTEDRENLGRVSRDGQYAAGSGSRTWSHDRDAVLLYDFTPPAGPYIATELNAAPGTIPAVITGVTQPIDGLRRVYGTLTFASPPTGGVIWTLPFSQAARDDFWTSILDVTPNADRIMGVHAGQYYLRGDGTDWLLAAPITPLIMSSPEARRISDDGRVAVGHAAGPTVWRDAVIWRRGQLPTTLLAIMTGAGVSMPDWTRGSEMVGVSADGSVVTGIRWVPSIDGTFIVPRGFVAVLPAVNDNCATARAITYGTVIASTNGATRAGVSGTCASEGTAPDVWFSFVPLANETVTIDTCGSDFDTTLNIFQASSCALVGAALTCNDEASPSCSGNVHASRLTANVFAGTNYFIRVSGWNGVFGSVRLTITAPNRPVNDSCAQATSVVPGSGVLPGTAVAFNNANAITDSRPPCGGTPFNDVWFKSVAPGNGRMTFSTCGSSINTVMAVYDASACADFSVPAIACGSSNAACAAVGGGNGTRITVPCTTGQTLLVRVGGLFGSSGSGQFSSTFACDQDSYSPYSVAVRNSGSINYWRFDDTGSTIAADAMRFDMYSCGNRPGEYIGNVIRTNDFQGKALTLDGTGGYARVWGTTSITTPSQCPGSNGRATMEAWIKTTDPMAGVVLTNRTNPGEFSLTLVVGYNTVGIPNTAGKIMFIADGPGNFHGAISTDRVDDGRWHHIIGVRTASGPAQVYYVVVDGVLQGYGNLPGAGTAQSGLDGAYWNIGNGPAWPVADAAFNGKIDEVAIYCGEPNLSTHYTTGRPCVADLDDGTGTGNTDGGVGIEDLLYYLSVYDQGTSRADVDDGSGLGRPDGGVGIEDLLYLLVHYDAGC